MIIGSWWWIDWWMNIRETDMPITITITSTAKLWCVSGCFDTTGLHGSWRSTAAYHGYGSWPVLLPLMSVPPAATTHSYGWLSPQPGFKTPKQELYHEPQPSRGISAWCECQMPHCMRAWMWGYVPKDSLANCAPASLWSSFPSKYNKSSWSLQ